LIDHVSITVRNLAMAANFYDAIMAALGFPCVYRTERVLGYGVRDRPGYRVPYISIFQADSVVADRRHWAFAAKSRSAIDRFHAAALAAGGSDGGAPGLRTDYHPDYYAAFVRDPDGNRIEAVCHLPE
jgi:catechol 2,3-dioxygenase-like lactoylglutathione lyase family enzyme